MPKNIYVAQDNYSLTEDFRLIISTKSGLPLSFVEEARTVGGPKKNDGDYNRGIIGARLIAPCRQLIMIVKE
jgi:hypothetical protein